MTFGPYSPVSRAGDYYFVSGQIGVDTSTKTAKANVIAQTHQALKNLGRLLESQGLSLDHVVKTTVFLKNMDDFATVNEVYVAYFTEPRPARSCIEVAGLPRITNTELLVEIEAVAYKPKTNASTVL